METLLIHGLEPTYLLSNMENLEPQSHKSWYVNLEGETTDF